MENSDNFVDEKEVGYKAKIIKEDLMNKYNKVDIIGVILDIRKHVKNSNGKQGMVEY